MVQFDVQDENKMLFRICRKNPTQNKFIIMLRQALLWQQM